MALSLKEQIDRYARLVSKIKIADKTSLEWNIEAAKVAANVFGKPYCVVKSPHRFDFMAKSVVRKPVVFEAQPRRRELW